jgi:hypothetical protein
MKIKIKIFKRNQTENYKRKKNTNKPNITNINIEQNKNTG